MKEIILVSASPTPPLLPTQTGWSIAEYGTIFGIGVGGITLIWGFTKLIWMSNTHYNKLNNGIEKLDSKFNVLTEKKNELQERAENLEYNVQNLIEHLNDADSLENLKVSWKNK